MKNQINLAHLSASDNSFIDSLYEEFINETNEIEIG